MFVDGGPGPPRDADAFFAGYGDVEIDPVVIAYYRFEWVVEELADYGRRTFLMPELGDSTKTEAVELFMTIFEPGEVVGTALQAQNVLGRL
jgi:spectinomycin phosphotransferase